LTLITALQLLRSSGPRSLSTAAGTPFTAEARIASRGKHIGKNCIKIARDGKSRAYIYECCWGHVTNCSRTYIDVYSQIFKEP
jgi:hypothetical protein